MTRAKLFNDGQPLSVACDSTVVEHGGGRLLAPVERAKLDRRICSKCLATSSRKEKQVPPGLQSKSTVVRLKQLIKIASAAGIIINSIECSLDGTIRLSSEARPAEPDDIFARLQDQL